MAILLRTAVCVALSSVAACASLENKPIRPDLPWPEIRADFRLEALRTRMREYSSTFTAEVDRAATAIERRTADSAVRRNAMLWKLRAAPEMQKACFRVEPVSALVDAWTLARQMDLFFTKGAGAAAFGPFQAEVVEVSGRLVDQMREIGDSIAVSPEARAQLERSIVEPWLATHPLVDMTFVRESPIARLAEQTRARGDVFQSVGTIDDMILALSSQARIYLADLPRQIRGEIDLLRADVLPPETLASVLRDVNSSAAAADRIAAIAEGAPDLLRDERRLVLDEVSRQRALVMQALSGERELAIGAMNRAIGMERNALLRDLEAQRLATLVWATSERREATDAVRRDLAEAVRALRHERAAVTTDVRRIVDVVLLRLALFIVVALALAPLVAHAYARVWPRRWRERPSSGQERVPPSR